MALHVTAPTHPHLVVDGVHYEKRQATHHLLLLVRGGLNWIVYTGEVHRYLR